MTFNPDNPNEHKEYNDKLREFNQLPTIEKLKRIAEALNKKTGQAIDFKKYQARYYLAYDYNTKSIMQLVSGNQIKVGGVIYCLHQDFKKIAVEKIEEQELIKYLKNEI